MLIVRKCRKVENSAALGSNNSSEVFFRAKFLMLLHYLTAHCLVGVVSAKLNIDLTHPEVTSGTLAVQKNYVLERSWTHLPPFTMPSRRIID